MISGQVPPHSRDAEECVIGGILIEPEVLKVVTQNLSANDFYIESHKVIYEAMVALSNAGQPIDMITLGNILRDQGDLGRIGGNRYLARIIDATPTTANIKHHARIVKKKAMVRRAVYVAQKVVSAGYNGADVDEAISHYLKTADYLRKARRDEAHVHTLADVMPAVEEQYERTKRGEMGVPFPWETMTNMCMSADTEVYDAGTGVVGLISEVCSDKTGQIATWSKYSGVHTGQTSMRGKIGHRSCIRIEMESGRVLVGTPEHPVLTPTGWCHLGNIHKGQSVAAVAKYPKPTNCIDVPLEHMVLMGMFLSDGCITGSHVNVTAFDNGVVDRLRECAKAIGCRVKTSQDGQYYLSNINGDIDRERDKDGRFLNGARYNLAQKLLDGYMMKREHAHQKEIPDVVFRADTGKVAAFLGSMWSGDGYINVTSNGVLVGIKLTSKKMIHQIRDLLLRIGVVSGVGKKINGGITRINGRLCNTKDQYRLYVPAEYHGVFFDTVGEYLFGNRAADMGIAIESDSKRKFTHGCVVDIGSDQKESLELEFNRQKGRPGAKGIGLGIFTSLSENGLQRNAETFNGLFIREVRDGKKVYSSKIQVNVLKHLLHVLGRTQMMWIVDSSIWWDSVVNIEDAPEQDVFDMTVPVTHCFVANGLVVHNTLGLWPGTLTFFVARPGCGKCIEFSSILTDAVTGLQRTIRDIVEGTEDVDRVQTWSKNQGSHVRGIDAKINSGVRSCVKVRTRTGREIILTPEHPLLTPGGWRRTDSLGVGASIAIPSKMDFPSCPVGDVDVNGAAVDLLAVLLTEGTYTGHHTGFSTADDAIVTIMKEAAEVFNVDLKYRGKYGYDFVRRGFGSHPVNDLLRHHGMWRKKAVGKTIPDVVFRFDEKRLAQFVSVFWMCDGYISNGAPGIVLASEVMIRQMQSLLIRFAVQSRVSYKPVKYKGEIRDSWRLRVVSMSLQAFYDSFSLWGKKHEALKKSIIVKRNPNMGFPRLPENMIERIKTISESGSGRWRGGFHEKVAEELGWSQFQTSNLFSKSGTLKLTAFKGWCKVYGVEDEFKWLWSSDIFWDEIEHVEDVGDQRVYDLTVRPTSCFVANDIIVHNSWTAVFIAWNAWLKGYKILIVSPEMTRAELGERVVARHGELHYSNLVAGELGMFGEQKFYETTKELRGADSERFIIIDDEDHLEPSFIEHVIDDEKPAIILVDSVYMMRVADGGVKSGPGSKGGRYDRILSTVDWLRSTARRTMIPVVGVSQLAREGAKLKREQKKKVKKGQSTGGLEGSLAMTDTILWDVNNLFAMYQDDDMVLHKQMMYVPLKVRRRAQISGVVTTWDMETMNFDEVGTHIETDDDFDDPNFSSDIPF